MSGPTKILEILLQDFKKKDFKKILQKLLDKDLIVI